MDDGNRARRELARPWLAGAWRRIREAERTRDLLKFAIASVTFCGVVVPFLVDYWISGTLLSIELDMFEDWPASIPHVFEGLTPEQQLDLAAAVMIEQSDRANAILIFTSVKLAVATLVVAAVELMRQNAPRLTNRAASTHPVHKLLNSGMRHLWRGVLAGSILWLVWQAWQLCVFAYVLSPITDDLVHQAVDGYLPFFPELQRLIIEPAYAVKVDLAVNQSVHRLHQAALTARALLLGVGPLILATITIIVYLERGDSRPQQRAWRTPAVAWSFVIFGLGSAAQMLVLLESFVSDVFGLVSGLDVVNIQPCGSCLVGAAGVSVTG